MVNENNNKFFYGCIIVIVLAVLLMVGWYLKQDGILTAAIIGIISAICAALFGYQIGKKST